MRSVQTNRGTPGQIVMDKLRHYPLGVRVAAGKLNSLKRNVRCKKRGHLPVEPASIRDIGELPDEFITTGGADNLDFLIYDSYSEEEDNGDRLIVFATERGLRCLCSADQWFMDGTFGAAPRQFQQLFIIRAMEDNIPVTCVYAFLPSKEQSAYEDVLSAVMLSCNNMGLDPEPSTVSCDYELAIHNAVRSTIGDVNIQACFYHLTQSTWRRIQELGLTTLYKEDDDVKLFCGMLDALAFLPVDRVKDGMRHLKTVIPDGVYDLVEYFDSTYVSGPFRSLRVGGMLRMRRTGEPRFPLDTWNVHQTTVDDGHRTNNICESWNNGFSRLVGHKHPGLWHTIQCIQTDQLSALTELERIRLGDPEVRHVRRETKRLQKRLKTNCDQFLRGQKTIPEFLQAVGLNIRFL